jgi:hypothetical protein
MKVKFEYDASMTLINCLETLKKILPQFGVKLTMLDGGDGYEEIELTKIEKETNGQSS